MNALLKELEVVATVSSGFRPSAANSNAGGAKKSAHMSGEAIDLVDIDGKLKVKMSLELLKKYDLYMESGEYTKTWLHLQTRPTRSGRRIFIP